MNRNCKACNAAIVGRTDKLFCSSTCKSSFHKLLTKESTETIIKIDKVLHRNRSILLQLLGSNNLSRIVPRQWLDERKFKASFMTAYHFNTQNQLVHFVYDVSWMRASDQEVLIERVTLGYSPD